MTGEMSIFTGPGGKSIETWREEDGYEKLTSYPLQETLMD